MSHTNTISINTELEHIEMAKARYEELVRSISADLVSAVTPSSKLALTLLLDHATAGVSMARNGKSQILSSMASMGSH